MGEPAFSVIIPAHNAGRYIREALDSAAAQSHPPHEIIVINDRSTDDTVEQVQRSGVDVRLLHADVGNAAAARNAGIEVASGDWLAMLDADDRWMPHHLQRIAELVGETSDVAFMAGFRFMDPAGNELVVTRGPLSSPATGLTDQQYLDLYSRALSFGHLTAAMNRERVLAVGGFDPDLRRRHDFDLWLRVIRGRTWAFDPEVHGNYRTNQSTSISSRVAESNLYALRVLIKNRALYGGVTTYERLLHRAAHVAASSALMEGVPADRAAAYREAWAHLARWRRVLYRIRPAGKLLIRLHRLWIAWKRRRSIEGE